MLGMEKDIHGEKIKRAITAKGSAIATFYGTRKDHKEVEMGREADGPAVRPVCGAKECHTKRISYILCKILTEIIPKVGTNCQDTDDLLAEIEKVNKERRVIHS